MDRSVRAPLFAAVKCLILWVNRLARIFVHPAGAAMGGESVAKTSCPHEPPNPPKTTLKVDPSRIKATKIKAGRGDVSR